MKKSGTFILVYVLSLYLISYCALYYFRRPAANLAYWGYTENTPEWVESCMYYAFYPPYVVHQRIFHAQRHAWDRPTIHYPPDFQG